MPVYASTIAVMEPHLRLSVCDSGAGFVELPLLRRLLLGSRSDLRSLHDHARTGVPSQNGIVVSGCCKTHGSLIVIHGFPQRVICGCAGSSTAMANARIPQTLPDDALVVGPLVVTLNLRKNLLCGFHIHMRLELVGSRQQKGNQRLLVIGHDRSEERRV